VRTPPTPSAPFDPALARKAVERAGGLCCLCGRPCRPVDARRHSGPGAFGDSPANFAPMCPACRAWVDEGGPPPARYVVHVWQGPRAWVRHLQRALFGVFAAVVAVVAAGYVALVALVLYGASRGGVWDAIGATLFLLLLLVVGAAVFRAPSASEGKMQR
jgi:hypothetical protein